MEKQIDENKDGKPQELLASTDINREFEKEKKPKNIVEKVKMRQYKQNERRTWKQILENGQFLCEKRQNMRRSINRKPKLYFCCVEI